MMWGALLLRDLDDFGLIYVTMNLSLYQKILKEYVQLCCCGFKLKHVWFVHQYSDPRHTIKSTFDWPFIACIPLLSLPYFVSSYLCQET